MTRAYNMDCMEALRQTPDKYYDLAVVDPPYGGGAQGAYAEKGDLRGGSADFESRSRGRFGRGHFKRYYVGNGKGPSAKEDDMPEKLGAEISATRKGGTWAAKYQAHTGGYSTDVGHWDIAPPPEYFNELARVSKNQIIWGGNYFDLPPTRCFLIWDKLNISENFSMAMCEYAWTSFNDNAKIYKHTPQGTRKNPRIHPTQKPIALYAWIYARYAKPGDKILDTHLGSGSSRIAAYDAGLDFTGYEIDKVYFGLEEERFARYVAQKQQNEN